MVEQEQKKEYLDGYRRLFSWQKGKDKKVYQIWQFWAAMSVFLLLSIYGGIRSGGEPALAAESPDYAFTPPTPQSTAEFNLELDPIAPPEGADAPSMGKIMKLVPDGLIKRLNEKDRKLFINDPVWKITSYKRQEHAVRLVAEYLDWVQGNSAGWVDVRSFKNGGRIALLDPMGKLKVR